MENIEEIKHAREEKVRKFKKKVSKDIAAHLRRVLPSLHTIRYFDKKAQRNVEQAYILLSLSKFVQNPDSFMRVVQEFPDPQLVVYTVPDELLEIWTSSEFDFVDCFLFKCKNVGFDFGKFLHESYFACQFMSAEEVECWKNRLNTEREEAS